MEPTSVYEAVIAMIREMGSADASLIRAVLMRDNRLVGQKYFCTGGYAICTGGSDVVEFYDYDGKLLRTVQATKETGLAV